MEVEQQPSNTLINAVEERDCKDWRQVNASVELAVKSIKLHNRFVGLVERDDEIQDLETEPLDLSDDVYDRHLTEEDYPQLKTTKKNRR